LNWFLIHSVARSLILNWMASSNINLDATIQARIASSVCVKFYPHILLRHLTPILIPQFRIIQISFCCCYFSMKLRKFISFHCKWTPSGAARHLNCKEKHLGMRISSQNVFKIKSCKTV
jgi:hypothetical protein